MRSADHVAGKLLNGAETAVSSAAVQVAAERLDRKMVIVQNVGAGVCRVGVTGVTATTGLKLKADESVTFSSPFCPTQAIFAIRDGSTDTTVLVQQVVG